MPDAVGSVQLSPCLSEAVGASAVYGKGLREKSARCTAWLTLRTGPVGAGEEALEPRHPVCRL